MFEGLILAVIVILGLFVLALKISDNLWFGFGALLFFLPFERIPSLEISGFTLKINHLIGVLLLFFWLPKLIRRQNLLRYKTWFYFLGGLFASFAFSMLNSHLLSHSLILFFTNLFVAGLFLLTVDLIRSRFDLNKASRLVTLASFFVVGFALYQFVGDIAGLPLALTGLDAGYSRQVFGFPRVQAFSKEPLYLASYLFLPLSLLGAHLVSRRKKSNSQLLALLGLGLVFLLTLSRGGISGLILALSISGAWYARSFLTWANIFRVVLALALILSFAWGLLRVSSPASAKRFLDHLRVADLRSGESTQGRLMAFGKALEAWRNHPIIGIGLGNYGAFSVDYDLSRPQVKDIVNNEYLELLAESGALGLGFFLALIVFLLARSLRALRKTNDKYLEALLVFLTASLVGMLWQYNFFSTFAIIHIWVMLGILAATQKIALKQSHEF